LNDWNWFDVPGKNKALLWTCSKSEKKSLFIKVYGIKDSMEIDAEKMVLNAYQKKTSLMPKVLTELQFDDFKILVCESSLARRLEVQEINNAIDAARIEMISLEPDDWLKSICTRTRPILADRFNDDRLLKLKVGISKECDQLLVDSLIKKYHILAYVLNKMPLIVFNQRLISTNIFMIQPDKPMLMSWAKWSLEPMGVGLVPKATRTQITAMLKKIAPLRPEFEQVTPEMVILTRSIAKLDTEIDNHNFMSCMEMIPNLLTLIDNFEAANDINPEKKGINFSHFKL
jgi:hypothetical protein